MDKTHLAMIEQIGHTIQTEAGEAVAREVMQGAEAITPKTPGDQVALWLKEAMQRLDNAAPPHTAQKIMHLCGQNCSLVNHSIIDRAKVRRARFKNEDDFLSAELRKTQKSSRLEREGTLLYQIYTPENLGHSIRCFCGLMRELPKDVQVSPTYCQCSKAFVQSFWSEVLGRPVQVTLVGSALTGSTECRFKIDLGQIV